MFGFFLLGQLPQNYATVMTTDSPAFNRFFHAMLDSGVYYAPALYEAGFVSSAHTLRILRLLWMRRSVFCCFLGCSRGRVLCMGLLAGSPGQG
jgi:glutamate-1-semialdehyde aminotransferase